MHAARGMDGTRDHEGFTRAVAEFYERHMVPLIFAPYAADLAARIAARRPARVLEVAAGTGVLTRELAKSLPGAEIVATDLNAPMLDHAASLCPSERVTWRPADAQELPFADESFDAVACQFGAMFFPDRVRAYAEARRVLRPGGTYFLSVWDRIEENEFADVVTRALAERYPDDPPRFLARTPHGYNDPAAIAADVASAGFGRAPVETRTERSRAPSPREPAVAYCEGTPLRGEIEAREPEGLAEATRLAERALADRFGEGPVEGRIQAHVVAVAR